MNNSIASKRSSFVIALLFANACSAYLAHLYFSWVTNGIGNVDPFASSPMFDYWPDHAGNPAKDGLPIIRAIALASSFLFAVLLLLPLQKISFSLNTHARKFALLGSLLLAAMLGLSASSLYFYLIADLPLSGFGPAKIFEYWQLYSADATARISLAASTFAGTAPFLTVIAFMTVAAWLDTRAHAAQTSQIG